LGSHQSDGAKARIANSLESSTTIGCPVRAAAKSDETRHVGEKASNLAALIAK
jgi:hypothetical protein